ncbi:DUF4288 domain-containing protein [Bacterioplanoides sp.]|uniref:DUF4288 domain-containing protein n=1 Tax=Bacterioplanoides sp. TaxID=2066072 RepID=UPI003B5C3F5E
MSEWKVYAVKTLYRTKTSGVAHSQAEGYSDEFDMVEERIVTIKARSFDEATKRAEREAEEYASDSFINPFGQQVSWYFTGESVAFEPFDSVPANIEVFSNTYLIPRTMSDEQLGDNVLGVAHENEQNLRLNFLNSELAGFR